jgi:hypothetical protein
LSDVISLPPEQTEAAIARIRAEKERRAAERIEAGEIVSIQLFIVAGSETEAHGKVEQAKADKLAELRTAGDLREGVIRRDNGRCRRGQVRGSYRRAVEADGAAILAGAQAGRGRRGRGGSGNPQPVIESYVSVQTRACHDDDDAGEIAEGWFSIDGKVLTVTDTNGKYVGSRAMIAGEDARVVAKQLLREKKVPEGEDFNRRLDYPKLGIA